MAKGIEKSSQPAPSLGVHNTKNVLEINPNQVLRAVNCHMDTDGVLHTRRGSRRVNTTALAGAASVYEYRRPYGATYQRFILAAAGNKLYLYDEPANRFDELYTLSNSNQVSWVTYMNGSGGSALFLCNGEDFLMWDGIAPVSTVTIDTGISAPRYLVAYDDRLLASGCDTDPNRVFVSDTLDGTTWVWGAEGSETVQYWTVKNYEGDRVTGLGTVYDYGVIFQQFGVTIITGADVSDSGTQQIRVANGYGTTSHWSVQSVGNTLYFADATHIYRGILRSAIENGLDVIPIDDGIADRYAELRNPTKITSVYDPAHECIQWGCQIGGGVRNDTILVYSLHSGQKVDMGWVDIWAGWHTGIEPYSLSHVLDANGKPQIWRGDERGFVYVMEESGHYKDDDYNTFTSESVYAFSQFNGWKPNGAYSGTVLNETWSSSSFAAGDNELVFNTAGIQLVNNRSGGVLGLALLSSNDRDYVAPTQYSSVSFTSSNISLSLTYADGTTTSITPTVEFSGYAIDQSSSYATARNNTTAFTTGTIIKVGQDLFGEDTIYQVFRSFIIFTLPQSNKTIASCSLHLDGSTDTSTTNFNIEIVEANMPHDIPTEIVTGAWVPQGTGVSKFARWFAPTLYQKHADSTTLEWIVDASYSKPDGGLTISVRNLAPYWNSNTTDQLVSQWGQFAWSSRPYVIRLVDINEPFRYIQFRVYNAGTNNTDEIAYAGGELYYQPGVIDHTQG